MIPNQRSGRGGSSEAAAGPPGRCSSASAGLCAPHLAAASHQIQFASPRKQRPHSKYSHLTLKCEEENYPLQFQFNPNHNE